MADVLTLPGYGTNSGVPAPYLQGLIFPSGQALGGQIALGMGRMTRRFSDIVSTEGGTTISESQLQSLLTAVAQGAASQQIVNYNFDGMVGPPGPPGETIVQYLPPVNGIGSVGRYGEDGEDGEDAFADIDIPIPYTGTATKWESCFTNNSPGAGSVAWTSFYVKYKGQVYTVSASNTSNGWLYWDAASPTAISTSATQPSIAAGQFLVGRNNSGTFEPSMFQKLITSGFISVAQLSAIVADLGTITAGTITMNLGSTYRLRMSPNGIQGSINSGSSYFDIIDLDGTDVVIQGTKLKIGSVDTKQIADDATKILTPKYYAGALGAITTSEVEYGALTHASDGGSVHVKASCIINNASATTVVNPAFGLYYNSVLVGTTTEATIGIGQYRTVSIDAYVASGSGNKALSFTAIRGAGESTKTYIYNLYMEAMEDKGK